MLVVASDIHLVDGTCAKTISPGTWHSYIAITAKDRAHLHQPEEFVPYQAMTYLAFYADDERGGRGFEACSGAFA